MRQFVARARHIACSPYKMRPVVDVVRGKDVPFALHWLSVYKVKNSAILKKVLESAIANAEHNDGADIDELKVSRVFVDEATTHKRMRARAKGRANRILKRTSHITVEVSDK